MAPDRALITQWMDEASTGLDMAFERLAGAVQDDLYRFALAHGLDRDDAAEATQETLLRAYRTRGRWRKGGDAMTWLFGIAMNVIRECRRRGRLDHAQGPDLDAVCAANASADSAGAGEQDLGELWAAIERLPPRQREAISCRYLRRMSVRTTAAVMGCAEGTVKAAVAAALESLRNCPILRHLQEE